jgi:4-amino-4-deoxy-L-arabinose transferase-like glycosyltransferase
MDKKTNLMRRILSLYKNHLFILFAIVVIGLSLRAHNLSTWPRLGATFDEYAWTWLGINLIKEKAPSSWSPHMQYKEYDRKYIVYQGAQFWVVKPYLEHPPVFGIIAGGFAVLRGADDMFQINLSLIRPFAVILGALSILLIYLLVREIYDKETAIFASLFYSIIPTIAIGSRLVQNENFFIPLYLLALFLIARFIKTKKKVLRNISALICGLLIVSKIPWIAGGLGIVAILFYNRLYKDGIFIALVVLVFFMGYLVYGYYFSWDLFVNLWKLQLERYDLTFNSFFALFTEPFLADRFMIDGWIYFGWISFFILLTKDLKKNIFVILGLLSYLAVFIFAIPNEEAHGWYRYPFYPFLAISLALFIKEYFNKNLLLTTTFFLFVILSLLELTWKNVFGFSFPVFRIFLFLCAISLLPLFFKNNRLNKVTSIINKFFFMIAIFLSIWAVLGYNEM